MSITPQAWGWTRALRADTSPNCVSPTGVGMHRGQLGAAQNIYCLPHRRGNGPSAIHLTHQRWTFPHARGDGLENHSGRRFDNCYPHDVRINPITLKQQGLITCHTHHLFHS